MCKSGTTIAILLAVGTLGIPGWAFAQRDAALVGELRLAAAILEQTMTAEVLTVNRAARTLTVRSVVDGRVFSVNESVPGDVVRITT